MVEPFHHGQLDLEHRVGFLQERNALLMQLVLLETNVAHAGFGHFCRAEDLGDH